jgi:hypothetical protein
LQSVLREDIPLLNGSMFAKLQKESECIIASQGAELALATSYVLPLFLVKATDELKAEQMLCKLLSALPIVDGEAEPRMNVLTIYTQCEGWLILLFPRAKHRPDCYMLEGESKRMISPGLLDIAGVVVTVRSDDFNALTEDEVKAILREVALSEEECRKVCDKIVSNEQKSNRV